MNVITLTGHATKDAELTYGPSGTAFAKGTIAVRRDFKSQNGEYETDFINFASIGKISETLANYIKKGDKFGITGRLQIRTFEQEGKRQYFTEVVVSGFDFPNKREENGNTGNNQSSYGNNSGNSGNKGNSNYTRVDDDPFANSGKPFDIDDSSLPF